MIAGNIDPATIHLYVLVPDELTSLAAALSEAHPKDDVVESSLESDHQILTGNTGDMVRALEETSKLLLGHPVDALDLLLLTELTSIIRLLPSALLRWTMLSRRIRTALHGTLFGIALLTLQEQLLILATAKLADGSSVTGHIV
jgi:hypothetical protein